MDSTPHHSLTLPVTIAIILCIAASTFFPPCDARSHGRVVSHQVPNNYKPHWKKLKSLNRLDNYYYSPLMGFSSSEISYASPSSLPLPPFNSLAPTPIESPPRSNAHSGTTLSPGPPKRGPGPGPSPSPSPSSPLVYLPPLVYPPPPTAATTSSPPPQKKPEYANWCVAKPTVPDPIIQEAMDYACGSGADCKSIQPNGPCYQPNTLLAHASYAFNNYWQNTKVGGGTCDFGGTAMLVTVDPSFDKCHFMLI